MQADNTIGYVKETMPNIKASIQSGMEKPRLDNVTLFFFKKKFDKIYI